MTASATMLEPVAPEDLVADFAFLDDWEERYKHLIDLGRKLTPMDDHLKTEDTKVKGCVSQVWLVPQVVEGQPDRLTFLADSDAHIVRGLIALLLMVYGGRTAREIASMDPDPMFTELGLDQHLSPNRRNGLGAMVQRMRDLAHARLAAQQEHRP